MSSMPCARRSARWPSATRAWSMCGWGRLPPSGQRREVLEQLAKLEREAEVLCGGAGKAQPMGADAERGAFVAPTLLYCRDTSSARAIHSVEAFGPVCTVVPYDSLDAAIALARRGGGSLAGSVFTRRRRACGTAGAGARAVSRAHRGRQSPLREGVHRPRVAFAAPGARRPGRAGGGEEMGGIRGVMHYMQRTARAGHAGCHSAAGGPLGQGRAPARSGRASVPQALQRRW